MSAEKKKNYYDVLQVPRDASAEQIKESYRKLAREYHPDKNPDHNDEFKEISAAYEILSDPKKRYEFDSEQANKGRPHTFTHPDMFNFNFGIPNLIRQHMDLFDHLLNAYSMYAPENFGRRRPDSGVTDPFGNVFYGFNGFEIPKPKKKSRWDTKEENSERDSYVEFCARLTEKAPSFGEGTSKGPVRGEMHRKRSAERAARDPNSRFAASSSQEPSEGPTRIRLWPKPDAAGPSSSSNGPNKMGFMPRSVRIPNPQEKPAEPEVIVIDSESNSSAEDAASTESMDTLPEVEIDEEEVEEVKKPEVITLYSDDEDEDSKK